MKHNLFTTLLVMLMSMTADNAFAYDAQIDGIYYNFSGDEAEVTSGDDKYEGSIVIPVSVNYNNQTYSVSTIGEYAFDDCSDLTSITIPNGVTNIKFRSFFGCSKLTSVTIPYSVMSIENMAFSGCSSLTSITVEEGNIKYDSRDNCNAIIETESNTLITGCQNTIILNSVTSIGYAAFYGCSCLFSISIPNSVTSIGSYAFQETGLNSIEIPKSVTSIGTFAFFRSCLTSIEIPSSVTVIGQSAFSWCSGLTSISVESGNAKYDSRDNCNAIIETESNTLIVGCKNTNIPNSITSIGYEAFYKCTDMTSITIPNSITSIGWSAFWGCDGLTSITIPNSVTSIGIQAFGYCRGLTSITIPNSVTSIENGTFNTCSNLSSVVIPNSVTSIGSNAFSWCKKLYSITVPNSVTSIGDWAFQGCTSLTSVMIEKTKPINITAGVFTNRANTNLYVPKGFKDSYEAADYWKEFKTIVEYDAHATIAIGSSGIMTYSNNSDLNFTGVSGLKAYIASGFNPATGDLTMTRVYKVPAGEGLLVKGAAGSYEVPYEETNAYYANLLVGVPTATTVNPTDGDYTNFILANDEVKGIGFYPLASAGEIGANKAYLQLPTSILPAASRSLRMVFDDEEDVTGVNALNDKLKMINDKAVYDLQGRRVVKPTRGLYIKDGKKIMVK